MSDGQHQMIACTVEKHAQLNCLIAKHAQLNCLIAEHAQLNYLIAKHAQLNCLIAKHAQLNCLIQCKLAQELCALVQSIYALHCAQIECLLKNVLVRDTWKMEQQHCISPNGAHAHYLRVHVLTI